MKSTSNLRKVPVMLLFFNRPQCLQQVFDAVRIYEPEELFLVQDGPRLGRNDDIENVEKCRKIVENVDWACNVRCNYSNENMSCDDREYTGIDWCFQYVDRLIILEDDCVPTQSFMRLCEECLEKYKDETNIHSIYGFNRVGDYECPYDYTFSKSGAGWGWATWKRVWDRVNTIRQSHLYNDFEALKYIKRASDNSLTSIYGDFLTTYKQLKEKEQSEGMVCSWENWVGLTQILYDMVTIAPKQNLIRYIGITYNSTHTTADARCLPYKVRKVLMQDVHEFKGEIKHPPFIVRDTLFEKLSSNIMKYPPMIAKIEVGLKKIWFHKIRRKKHIHE